MPKANKDGVVSATSETAEGRRLKENESPERPWHRWGPYLSERQWGTVREDYSEEGGAWEYFPHDHARSRAYRWGEDGLLGISDRKGLLCFAIALWNGNDPILKERLFGLTNSQGNHGEDVKEAYAYLDGTPSHSYLKGRYHYPHAVFPYEALIEENAAAGKQAPEVELDDLGVFSESRYFEIDIEYARPSTDEIFIRVRATNRGPDPHRLVFLPQIWFRNRWSWAPGTEKPSLSRLRGDLLSVEQVQLGKMALTASSEVHWIFAENETNFLRLYGSEVGTPHSKDAFHRFVVNGDAGAVNPAFHGTKAAGVYDIELPSGEAKVWTFRLGSRQSPLDADEVEAVFTQAIAEADEFYEALSPGLPVEAALVQRQAFAGLIWSKQFYHFDVSRWLDGDDAEPKPPLIRKDGRNAAWRHFHTADVMSMPDKWEYPWFAAWDLAFHCIPLAVIDPTFAKDQLILLMREWLMHPSGQVPAYEWAFGDVNPPVHAWAAWRVYTIEKRAVGKGDIDFLEKCFHKLLLNFTWWVNRKDPQGNNVFEGGFLGLDNIGIFDRNCPLGDDVWVEQSDGTSWMATFCLNMLTMALELSKHDQVYEDVATKFLEHFLYIARATNNIGPEDVPLWDEEDGFYYDVVCHKGAAPIFVKVRSVVGLIPLLAVMTFEADTLDQFPGYQKRMQWFLDNRPELSEYVASMEEPGMKERHLLSLATPERLRRVLSRLLDEGEFLSPHGIRSLSKVYREPYRLEIQAQHFAIDYEPAESTSGLFGGNSNWRGPVWFPINYLLIETLQKLDYYFGTNFKIEMPTGSGIEMTLAQVAEDLEKRLLSLFLPNESGARSYLGGSPGMGEDVVHFHEYFDGETGRGLGASHQTGWTALIAKIIQQLYVTVPMRDD